MAKEDIKLRLPVVPELDRRGTSNLLKDIKRLESDLGKLDVSWKSIGKTASLNVKEINKITTAASHLTKELSVAAKESYKELQGLGKQLSEAKSKAKTLAKEYGSSKGGRKEDIGKQLGLTMKSITDLNKQIDAQKDKTKKYNSELERGLKAQQKNILTLKQAAGYSAKDAIGDILSKFHSKDLTGALGKMAKGIGSGYLRTGMAKAESTGGPEGAQQMASLGAAATSMGAAAAAIGLFVKLILQASSHMAGLNKALTGGIGLSQEMGGRIGDYSKAVKDLRNAAIDAAGAMLKYGLTSKDALEMVNSFAKQSGMSLSELEIQLRDMGQGDLDKGMREFAINAQVYGHALGMEAKDVAGLMGQFVNEVGVSADNVTKTMGDIVKQAAQAGMPTQKFVDIFRQAIPNLDLFTNRIEELTGVMKMLSKTMDPRAVKGFMSAMGKGFDMLDFKQRLKMALVVGPGEMGNIMRDDLKRATESVKNNLKHLNLGDAMDEALKGPNSIAKMRKVAAMAMAKGATGAEVASINRLGRYAELQRGGVLKQTTGMREMGLMGRMEALEKLAGRFTGGDITGLGEHVAKQLGISEEEYKAILGMKDSLGDYTSSIEATGRTSSKSINEGLAKILNLPDPISDPKEFELATKKAMKKDPGGFRKALMTAATMEIEEEQQRAKDEAAAQESIEDLTSDQISATQSLGDKMENVMGYLLEKIYYILDDIFGFLNDLYSALPGWMSGSYSDLKKSIDNVSMTAKAELKDNQAGLAYYQDMATRLKAISDRGGKTVDYLNANTDLLTKQLHAGKESDAYYAKVQEDLKDVMDADDSQKFVQALKDSDITLSDKMLKQLDPDKAALLMAKLAKDQAKEERGGLGRGTLASQTKNDERAAKKQEQIARKQSDLDQRNLELMKQISGDVADAADTPVPVAHAAAIASGTPAGAAPPAVKAAAEVHRETAANTEQQAKATENLADQADAQYQATTDTLSLLKKGIRFENSWMTSKFQNVLKQASLDALRPALTEQLVGYAKIWTDSDLRQALAQHGDDLSGAIAPGLRGLSRSDDLTDLGKKLGLPGYATGITRVPHDMPAILHAGEQVVSKANAGKGSGKSVNVTIYAQGVPASQIAHHIANLHRSD